MTERILSRTKGPRTWVAFVTLLLASAGAVAQETSAEPPKTTADWKIIAKQSITFRGLIRRMSLASTSQPVLGLKVRTRGRRMTFSSIKVRYRNGKTHQARRRIRLKSGELSSAFAESKRGRLIDEVILIPDVSAPRRRAISVEILALMAPVAKAAEAKATATISSPSDNPTTNNIAKRTAASPTTDGTTAIEAASQTEQRSDAQEPAPQLEAEKQKEKEKVAVTAKPAVSAQSKQRDAVSTITTTPLNRLASTTKDVDLPSPRPKTESEEKTDAPAKINLGNPTRGGALLLGAGSLSSGDEQESFKIEVRPNRFRRLRMHLTGRDVRIAHVTLHYVGGSIQKEPFGVTLMRNTTSRWIVLDPANPLAKVVVQKVESDTSRGVSRVEILGEPVMDALLPETANSTGNNGWLLVAAQSGRALRSHDGHMPVAANRGGFAKLRLARIGRIPMPNRMLLQSGEDGTEVITLQLKNRSNEFDLSASQRVPIESVQLRFSARAINQLPSSGIFQLWAKY